MQLDPTVNAILNTHINAEYAAAYLYDAAASWADAQGYPPLVTWAQAEGAEERRHALMFTGYVNDRGGSVALDAILAPPANFETPLMLFQALLFAEYRVTDHLMQVAQVALQAGDFATMHLCAGWINSEQVPAIKFLTDVIAAISRGAPVDLLLHELFEAD